MNRLEKTWIPIQKKIQLFRVSKARNHQRRKENKESKVVVRVKRIHLKRDIRERRVSQREKRKRVIRKQRKARRRVESIRVVMIHQKSQVHHHLLHHQRSPGSQRNQRNSQRSNQRSRLRRVQLQSKK
jgi:hypothetical protein